MDLNTFEAVQGQIFIFYFFFCEEINGQTVHNIGHLKLGCTQRQTHCKKWMRFI